MFLSNPSRKTIRALVAAALSTAAFPFAARAQTPATWNTSTSGNWSDPTKWSTNPTVPNNGSPTAGSTYNAFITPAGTYTINQDLASVTIANLSVTQPGVTLNLGGNAFTTTSGTSLAGNLTTNGAALSLQSLNNSGTLSLTNGSLFVDSPSNIGKINATNTALTIYRGTFTTSQLPTQINRTGGSLIIGGSINNNGSVINVDSGLFQNVTLATMDVTGGTLTGTTGTLTLTDNPNWSNINRFTNVTLGGKVNSISAATWVYGDLTLANATFSEAFNLTFQDPNRTLAGTGTFTRCDLSGPNLTIGSGITFGFTNTNSRIGGYSATNSFATIRNDGFATMTTVGTFSNRGSITTTAGGYNLQTGTLTNYGSISLSNTNVEIPFDCAIINNGTFTATNTAFRFLGMRTPSDLSNFPLNGAGNSATLYSPFINNLLASGINATGATFTVSPTTSNIVLNGATLQGGRFQSSPGSFFDVIQSPSPAGTVPAFLYNTTFAARADLRNGSLLRAQGAVFDNAIINLSSTSTASTALQINGGETLTGSATITLNGTQNNGTVEPFSGTATIGPDIIVQTGTAGGRVGDPDLVDSLSNQGTLWARTTNKSLFITGKTFTNAGTLHASNGSTVSIFSLTSFSNVSSGTLTGGTYTVDAGASIDFSGRTFSTNAGDISLHGPNSTFAAVASLSNNQGSFTIDNARNFTSTSNLANSGTLRVGKDSTLTVNGTLTNTGKLKGKGTIRATAISSSGTIAPGDSPGLLTIDGSLTTDAASVLEIEFAGSTTPGTDYDVLNVLGSATFNGTLKILLTAGYVPNEFASFTFLSSPNLNVNFTTLDLPPLPSNMHWNTNALATGTLATTPEPTSLILLLPLILPARRRRPRPKAID
jgi:fibronectin-binding autotransporter adhesin